VRGEMMAYGRKKATTQVGNAMGASPLNGKIPLRTLYGNEGNHRENRGEQRKEERCSFFDSLKERKEVLQGKI